MTNEVTIKILNHGKAVESVKIDGAAVKTADDYKKIVMAKAMNAFSPLKARGKADTFTVSVNGATAEFAAAKVGYEADLEARRNAWAAKKAARTAKAGVMSACSRRKTSCPRERRAAAGKVQSQLAVMPRCAVPLGVAALGSVGLRFSTITFPVY